MPLYPIISEQSLSISHFQISTSHIFPGHPALGTPALARISYNVAMAACQVRRTKPKSSGSMASYGPIYTRYKY